VRNKPKLEEFYSKLFKSKPWQLMTRLYNKSLWILRKIQAKVWTKLKSSSLSLFTFSLNRPKKNLQSWFQLTKHLPQKSKTKWNSLSSYRATHQRKVQFKFKTSWTLDLLSLLPQLAWHQFQSPLLKTLNKCSEHIKRKNVKF
jgi:hypothetical protein